METTPGRRPAFEEEFARHVRTAGGWSALPKELIEKVCARAGAATPSQAAAVFLDVYWRAHRKSGIRDGMGWMLSVFSEEIAKAEPSAPHKPAQRAEAYDEPFEASIARLAQRNRL